jgi:hypothetical protein
LRRRGKGTILGLLGAQQVRQLTRLVHLFDNVAAADQLPVDVELGEGAPVGDLARYLPERDEER